MKTFGEVRLPGGGALIVNGSGHETAVRAGRDRQAGDFVEKSLESAIDTVTCAASVVRPSVLAMKKRADEITAQSATKLAAEMGAVIARSTAETNFRLGYAMGEC